MSNLMTNKKCFFEDGFHQLPHDLMHIAIAYICPGQCPSVLCWAGLICGSIQGLFPFPLWASFSSSFPISPFLRSHLLSLQKSVYCSFYVSYIMYALYPSHVIDEFVL